MSASDPVADMLTKIRNAAQARHEKVDISTSKLKLEIVKILKTEGFIKNFKKVQDEGRSIIRIFLKYDETNAPVIHGLKKISTPGRRVYSGYKDMPRIYNMALLSYQHLLVLQPVARLKRRWLAASSFALSGNRRKACLR